MIRRGFLKAFAAAVLSPALPLPKAPQSPGWTLTDAVDIANRKGADLWVNTPAAANSEAVDAMVDYLAAELAPGRNFRIEAVDETWNENWWPASRVGRRIGRRV